ncbi:MAG: D-glycero-beta-D-manno-heptose-7-phosphate kinase [bacterium]
MRFSKQKVLVVGDLILDEYLWGAVERISPEAPVQIVDIQKEFVTLGGAGNVIANLIRLGGQVRVCSIIGQDVHGRIILEEFERLGVPGGGIFEDSTRHTTKKSRILAANQQVLRIDREVRRPIDPALEKKVINYVGHSCEECAAIILSDYQKGVLTESVLQEIIGLARRQGKWVFVDPKGASFRKYRKAHFITPNQKEAALATGLSLHTEEHIRKAGETLLKELALEGVIMTRGKDGISLFQRKHHPLHLPTRAREVFDVSGAGDTVLASLALGYLAGLPLDEAAELANLAAGVVVGKVGTATVTPAEILAYGYNHAPSERKVKALPELLDLVSRHRLQGQRIVFTNGCFDLLHVGHIKLLQEARQLGDILIVAMNDDASVRRLKGPTRPCMSQEERAQVLSALNYIDYVVIFSEDTPEDVIRSLKPDVLVKGADYRKDQVVGWQLVESYGGSVRLVDIEADMSTSNLIARIVSNHRPGDE